MKSHNMADSQVATSESHDDGSSQNGESLHHALRDSTLHKKHSVHQLDFTEPPSFHSRVRGGISEIGEASRKRSCCEWLVCLIPMIGWVQDYKIQDLPNDLLAGFTVGAMVIPQGMSYAKLAGLPVEYGLYAAFTPVLGYALFGTCRQLSVGPVAVVSLLVSAGLTPLFSTDGEILPEQQMQYNQLAIQTSMMIGAIMIVMGLLRLGFISAFISHAVTSGFTSGAAVIIGASQLKYIFGINCPRSDQIVEIIRLLAENWDEFNWKSTLLGTLCIALLISLRIFGTKFPKYKMVSYAGPITVTIVCIILSWQLDFSSKGIKTVTKIPKGLPDFTVSWWGPFDHRIWKTVILAVIVGFMESISIARQLAAKNNYALDPSRELLGLGAANFFGSMFQSYPTTGSFSRSAILQATGSKTLLSAIFVSILVLITLLWLTPVFEFMPYASFAAIIISAAIFLLDYTEAMHLWKVDKLDFLVWVVCFLITMFVGVDFGIGVSVGLSLLFVLYETAYPHTAILGRLQGSSVYRNVKQYPDAEQYDGIVVVRIDAPLYFANSEYSREKLAKYEELSASKSSSPIKFLIIDMSPVSHIDSAGLHCLEDIFSCYKAKGITVIFCNPNRPVIEKLVSSGLVNRVGFKNFFVGVHDAVNTALLALGDEEGTALLLENHSSDQAETG